MNSLELIKILDKSFKNVVVKEPLQLSTIVPTGSMKLDKAIGVGGYPGGRITELYGNYSSGKSTLCLSACANAQKMGLLPVYLDMEHSFDQDYATILGIDMAEMIVIQPESAEQALGIIETVLQNESRFVVLDSVGAMTPHRETIDEGDVGDSHVGLIARLMTQGMRRLTPLVYNKDAVLILVNQLRAKIGGAPGFGGPGTDTPGGFALKHAYSLRIKLARASTEKDGDEASAITVAAEITKNKVAPPFTKTSFDIRFGLGIDTQDELLQICSESGLLKKSGSWWKDSEGNTLGQGSAAANEYLTTQNDRVKEAVATYCGKIQANFYL